MRRKQIPTILIGLTLLLTACKSTTTEKTSTSEKSPANKPADAVSTGFLRPPAFKAPRGSHYEDNGQLLPNDLYKRSSDLLAAASNSIIAVWEGFKPSDADYATMEKMLSDERLVGDGTYLDVGEQGGGWALSLYGTPAQSLPKIRLYPKGVGIPEKALIESLGKARIEGKTTDKTVVMYGRAAAIYDGADRFLGTVFYCSTR
jgi:hypothetical protein